jgi:hypothetical protein
MTGLNGSAQNAPGPAGSALTAPPPGSAAHPSGAADLLREVAGQRRVAGRAGELRSLADALDGLGGIDHWAEVDLFAAFLQEDTVGRPPWAWLGRLLDIVAQALFFAPIAVTWAGLMEATEAYRKTLRLKAAASQSFLQEWQSGFGGHLSRAFYLDRIAAYVVFLVILLVAAMVAQFIYHARVDEDHPARLYQELARALTAAALALAPRRVSAPGQATSELAKTAGEFARTASAIRDIGDTAQRTQAEARHGLKEVSTALASVEAAAQAAGSAAGGVSHAAEEMSQRLKDVNSTAQVVAAAEAEVARQVQATGDRLGGSVDGLAAKLTDAVRDGQQRMSAAVTDSVATVAGALGAGSVEVRSALAEVTTAGAAYTHRVEQAADVLGQAASVVDRMPGAVSGLEAGVAGLSGQVGDLGSQVTGLGHAVTATRAALPSPADIPADLRAALDDLREAAASLRAASATLQATGAQSPGAAGGGQPWLMVRRPRFGRRGP